MVMLSSVDRNRLIDLVKGKAYLIKQEKLESIFIKSGLQDLRTLVEFDLSGGAEAMLYNLITFLEDYGKIRPDHEALGLFLVAISNYVGIETKEFINKLLSNYNLVPSSDLLGGERSVAIESADQVQSALGTNLRIATRVSSQVNQIGPTGGVQPVETESGNEIRIGQEELKTISSRLSSQEQDLVKMYEKTIQERFRVWTVVYPQLVIEANPLIKAQLNVKLDEILKDMCNDWNQLFDLMKSKGIDLEVHYQHVIDICRRLKNKE